MPAIVTLTSDFGLRDPYVAEMKAAILGIAPDVRLVDITHDVAPFDITEAALALEAAATRFPPDTVHLAVVDPGVGTPRRGLAVVSGGFVFVGPDNGLFTSFLGEGGWEAWELSATEFRRAEVSRTFHGRDVFAPAAAHLAGGLSPGRLGPAVSDPLRLTWPEVRAVGGGVSGTVIHIDRFGNLVTSIRVETLATLGPDVVVRVGSAGLPLVGTYGDLEPGGAGALVGSSDRLEIAVREGSAQARLGARRGTAVLVGRGPKDAKSLSGAGGRGP